MRDPGSYLVLKLSQALFQKAPGLLAPKEYLKKVSTNCDAGAL